MSTAPTSPRPALQQLTLEGGALAYEVTGADDAVSAERPLVVLAHGMGDDHRAYRFLAPALAAAGHRVAALDLRGCGASTTGWSSYARTAIAGDLIALTEHLLTGEAEGAQAVLVGHSIAGGAATIAAASAPHLFTALVEVAPFTRKQSIGLAELRAPRVRRGMTHLVATAALGSTRAWARYLDLAHPVTAHGARPADYQARLAEIQAVLAEPGRMAALRKMGTAAPTDAGAQLANVACPVLVVQGSEDPDWADPRAEGERILAELPSGAVRGASRLEVVEGSGHYPHVQHPAQVAELVLRFLADVRAVRAARATTPPATRAER